MDTTLVTGYIPLQAISLHRSRDEYRELGQRLLDIGLPTIAFLDPNVPMLANPAATFQPYALESCWLINQARFAKLPPTDNPGKDTAEFHTIQLQKSHWMAAATRLSTSSTLIWLDFGILHIPGAMCTPSSVHRRSHHRRWYGRRIGGLLFGAAPPRLAA